MHYNVGMVVWSEDDSGRNVTQEPAGLEQGHARAGQGKGQDGATGKENHRRHQKDGQARPNGVGQDHGQGQTSKLNNISFDPNCLFEKTLKLSLLFGRTFFGRFSGFGSD